MVLVHGSGSTSSIGLMTSSHSSRGGPKSKGSRAYGYGSLLDDSGTNGGAIRSQPEDGLKQHTDTMGDIIDGRFSYGEEGYVTVEVRLPSHRFRANPHYVHA